MNGRPSPEGTAVGIHPWHPCCRSGDRARGGCGLPRGTEVLAGRRDVEMVGWMDVMVFPFASVIVILACQCPVLGGPDDGFKGGQVGGQVVGKLVSGSYKIDVHNGMKGIEYWGTSHADVAKNKYAESGR